MIPFIKSCYKKYKAIRFIILSILGIIRIASTLILLVIYRTKSDRVLIIGPTHSNHLKNFLNTLTKNGNSKTPRILNISSYPNSTLLLNSGWKLIIDQPLYFIFGNGMDNLNWGKDLFINANIGFRKHIIWILKIVYKFYKPKKVWIHDLQSGGYLFNSIFNFSDINTKIFASAWGNDLIMFAKAPNHRANLKKLMARVNYLHIESHREIDLALDLGFKGDFFPISNVTLTSIDIYNSYYNNISSNKKKIFVVIKGSYFLRSNVLSFILQLSNNIDFWRDKKIIIINPSEEDCYHFSKLKYEYNLQIELKKGLHPEDFVKLLSQSKFHLILNTSDGIVNSATEAAFVNCIPVISSLSGLVDSLAPFIVKNIVYDFNEVDFRDMFHKLNQLDPEKKTLLLDGLREIYTEKLYNPSVQKYIIKKFLDE